MQQIQSQCLVRVPTFSFPMQLNYVCTCGSASTCLYMVVYVSECVHVCVCVHTHMCTYVYFCVYACILLGELEWKQFKIWSYPICGSIRL